MECIRMKNGVLQKLARATLCVGFRSAKGAIMVRRRVENVRRVMASSFSEFGHRGVSPQPHSKTDWLVCFCPQVLPDQR
jgi:hypothetical protein